MSGFRPISSPAAIAVVKGGTCARRGVSYVEVCLAMLIISVFLVPSLRVVPLVMAGQRDLEAKYELSLIAQERLEMALQDLGASFTARDESGNLTAYDHSDWRYRVVVKLRGLGHSAVIRSVTWIDADADTVRDDDEVQIRFDTIQADVQWSP